MNSSPPAHVSSNGHSCPGCGATVAAGQERCLSCGFTGGDTLTLFGGTAPPMTAMLDTVGVWTGEQWREIQAAAVALTRDFPQTRWRFCTVSLPASQPLPLFAFWFFNAAPLAEDESEDDRAWTALLTIDVRTGRASAVSGYALERWITGNDWAKILAEASTVATEKSPAEFPLAFLRTARSFLEHAWRTAGVKRKRKRKS